MLKMYVCCVILLLALPFEVNCVKIEGISKWHEFPYKIFTNTSMLQHSCQEAYSRLLNSLNNGEINALKMLDATAKVPSGILSGNVVQYGDFDECMGVADAQYCLVEMDLDNLWKNPYKQYRELVHSYYFFREKFNDPAHRLPGFTMIKWGFCIPRECSGSDLEKSLTENFGIKAQIRPGMCQKLKQEEKTLTMGDYITRTFFGTVLAAICAATLLDFYKVSKPEGAITQLLMSFSLRRNLSKFLEKKSDSDEIPGLHGVRAVNTLGLFLSHKAVSLFFNPYINRTATIDKLASPWTITAKNAIVYTDTFMLLSGLLNANALLTDLYNGRPMNFKNKLINRIFRILPNLLTLILFCTYILPSMGSGPLWPTTITHHSHLCKQFMWRNLLFVHNYFGFENMCLTHTHQLGIDMQLFLITPIFVYLIWNHKRVGLMTLLLASSASTVLRFWIAYKNELSSVVYFGIPVSKMFDIANLSYILPTHRATIYLMGVYLAYFLKVSRRSRPLSKIQTVCLWSFFLPVFLWSWCGQYHMVEKDFVYSKLEGSLINAFSPIFWGAGISFGIYAMNKNIAGWLGRFLCWSNFQYVTKLAYAIYLVQFPVFFYNVGLTRHVDEYQPQFLLQVWETGAIVVGSLVLVLFIEMPFQNIKKVLFDGKAGTKGMSINGDVKLARKQG